MRQKATSNGTDSIRQISSLISRLLAHYWAANEPEETRRAQVEDWLDDLAEFGPEVVTEACVRWRRQPGGRRPTPGDIRTFCIEERELRPDGLAIAADHTGGKLVDEEAYARSAGWSSALERRDAIEAEKQRQLNGERVTDISRNSRSVGRVAGAIAAQLGVTAREYAPTAEAMAAGRRALGIDQPLDPDAPRVQARLPDTQTQGENR